MKLNLSRTEKLKCCIWLPPPQVLSQRGIDSGYSEMYGLIISHPFPVRTTGCKEHPAESIISGKIRTISLFTFSGPYLLTAIGSSLQSRPPKGTDRGPKHTSPVRTKWKKSVSFPVLTDRECDFTPRSVRPRRKPFPCPRKAKQPPYLSAAQKKRPARGLFSNLSSYTFSNTGM